MDPAAVIPETVFPGAPMTRSFPMTVMAEPNRAFVWLVPVNALWLTYSISAPSVILPVALP